LLRRSKSKKKAAAEKAGASASGVVVASDDHDVRELLARVMARAGHDVEQVDDLETAVAALTTQPRLALLALFREGRSQALVQAVRDDDDPTVAAVPVVIVTDDDPEAQKVTAAGADGTLTRPFHADELTGEMDTVLARSPEDRAEMRDVAALNAED
jgi:DNA-binding response OmpR family regulator